MKCPVCKNDFNPDTGRRPKRFCSNACKVKFWNDFKKANQNTEEIKKVVMDKVVLGVGIAKTELSGEIKRIDPLSKEGKNILAHPRNLDELKALCPYPRGTDEFRVWVATERQKYGI